MKVNVSGIVNKKGTHIVDIKDTKELRSVVRKTYKRKKCTKKLIAKFVKDGISTQLKRKKNGNKKKNKS